MVYKWYFSCQVGDYMVPSPPIKGNQETPLISGTWNFQGDLPQLVTLWSLQASQELDQALRAAQGALACYKAGDFSWGKNIQKWWGFTQGTGAGGVGFLGEILQTWNLQMSSILGWKNPPRDGPNSTQNKGPHLGSRKLYAIFTELENYKDLY